MNVDANTEERPVWRMYPQQLQNIGICDYLPFMFH